MNGQFVINNNCVIFYFNDKKIKFDNLQDGLDWAKKEGYTAYYICPNCGSKQYGYDCLKCEMLKEQFDY